MESRRSATNSVQGYLDRLSKIERQLKAMGRARHLSTVAGLVGFGAFAAVGLSLCGVIPRIGLLVAIICIAVALVLGILAKFILDTV